MTTTSILANDNWTDKSINLIICDIYEYDMRRAGLSIAKELKLLPDSELERLSTMDKLEADKEMGKMKYKIKGFTKAQMEGFRYFRLLLGEANNLSDDDIISIKKDAVFSKKYCPEVSFGKYIYFANKHDYSAMMRFDKYEFYLSSHDNSIDVKGLSDDKVESHKDYILKDISKIMVLMTRNQKTDAIRYLVNLMDDYKYRRLPIGYYREFNSDNDYKVYLDNGTINQTSIAGDSYINRVIIQFNYITLLVPILNIIS